jgi:hypothetical protein
MILAMSKHEQGTKSRDFRGSVNETLDDRPDLLHVDYSQKCSDEVVINALLGILDFGGESYSTRE